MDKVQTLKKKLEVPENLVSILTKLISPEEIEILVLITENFLTTPAIVEKIGKKERNKISSMLRALYQKGFLRRKTIGGREAYMCKSFYDIILSHLHENRYDGLGLENIHTLRQYYTFTRIRNIEKTIENGQIKYSSKVIPIRKAFQATQYILPTQQAIEILKEASFFALAKCGCRVAFRNCDNPIDTCILLDEEAKYLVSRNCAKEISLEESEKVFEVANRTGLIHLALYMPGQKIYAICSCCPCCCHDLQALLKYGKNFFVAKSDFISICNTYLCRGCGACIKRCIFGAREIQNEKTVVKEDHCYGCGLCVTTCPSKASELVLRRKIRR